MWLVSDPSCASPNPSDTNSKPRPLPSPVSGEDRLAPRLIATFYHPPGLALYASTPLLVVIVGHNGCNKDVHSLRSQAYRRNHSIFSHRYLDFGGCY
jgi:hypothetical protein